MPVTTRGRPTAAAASALSPSRRWSALHALSRRTQQELRLRHALRLHVAIIAVLTLACLWAVSHGLLMAGVDTLALRYGVAVAVGYVVYLLLLRAWAASLARRESPLDGSGDLPLPDVGGGPGSAPHKVGAVEAPTCSPGGGGDFGGGGATGQFDAPVGGDSAGSMIEGAGELLGGADEGIVVILPLAVVVGVVMLIGGLLGAGVFMLFGVEVLLSVTGEVVLASVAGSVAYKGLSEGWLSAAWSRTWRGALAALVCAVALGATLDLGVPQARSFPHAIELWRQP